MVGALSDQPFIRGSLIAIARVVEWIVHLVLHARQLLADMLEQPGDPRRDLRLCGNRPGSEPTESGGAFRFAPHRRDTGDRNGVQPAPVLITTFHS